MKYIDLKDGPYKKLSDPKTYEAVAKAKRDFDSMMECLTNPVVEEGN